MQLEVCGMSTASETFVQLWGMYVYGFRPDKHCLACLKGKKEPLVKRDMTDDLYQLANHAPYFIYSPGAGGSGGTPMFTSPCAHNPVLSQASAQRMGSHSPFAMRSR